MKQNNKYRKIVESVPMELRNGYDSWVDSSGHISGNLRLFEKSQKSINNIFVIAFVAIVITMLPSCVSVIVLSKLLKSIPLASICGITFWVLSVVVVAVISIRKSKRFQDVSEVAEEKLQKFCNIVEALRPAFDSNGVPICYDQPMSRQTLEKELILDAYTLLCWQDKVRQACESKVDAQELYSLCGRLLKAGQRFYDMWNACQAFKVTERSQRSIFEEAKKMM